jgi:hypothetical protein
MLTTMTHEAVELWYHMNWSEPRRRTDQLARQENEEDDRRRQLGQPRTPEPMGMGMNVTNNNNNKPRLCQQGLTSPRPSTAVDELTQRLNTL